MRLVEIHLDGFGRLVDHTLRFASGFNLIFGPNEAGKSTLQRAMLSLFYGFWGKGRMTAAKRAVATVFHPWDESAPYSGSLIYALDSGQTFRVHRTFAPKPATSLMTYPDEADKEHPADKKHPVDVSNQFKKASQGRLFFADAQLGMGKEVFENTCYVRQAELVALEASANAITETLMRLAASASADTTAADAIALLEKTLKDEVGTSRAWTKPLPKALERLSGLEEERSQVLQARRELFSQIVELNQAEEKLHRLESERQRLRYLQALAENQAIRQRLSAADEADAEVSRCAEEMTRWQTWATFPVRLRDDVLRLTTQRNHLQRECSEAQQQAAIAREELEPVETQMAAVEKRVATLADARDVPTGEYPQVRELANQWRVANEAGRATSERWRKAHKALEEAEQRLVQEHAQLEPAVELGHAGLAALQQRLLSGRQRVAQTTERLNQAQAEWARVGMDEAQFQQLERTVQEIRSGIRPAPKPRKGCKALLSRKPAQSADQTSTELVIYAQIKPIYEGLIQSSAESEAARKALSDVEADASNQLGELIDNTLGDGAFVQLGQRLERHLRSVAEVDQQKVAVAGLKSELDADRQRYEEVHTALQARLIKLGFDATDVQVALDAYAKKCERKEKLEREEAELERLRLQVQAIERDIHDWQEKQAALKDVETELCTLLAQAGIECFTNTLEPALAKFNEGVDNYRHWAKAKAAYEAAMKHQSSLLDAQTRTMLETSLAEIESRLATMQAEHPEWSKLAPDKIPQEYATLSQQTDGAWVAGREQCNRLRESIHLATINLRHPAEIDEEISVAKAKIQRLEWFRDTLELAREELTQATQEFQKQFAPKLELLMSEGLSRVTRGRYSEVQVNHNSLAVSLTAPELDSSVGAEQLSVGTRDLVYLMLRISIARLMSRTEEKLPLLLDDPLVQCDRARQEQTLEFLAQLAEETQVFLFTKDEWTKAWFEENLESHSRHGLYLLS